MTGRTRIRLVKLLLLSQYLDMSEWYEGDCSGILPSNVMDSTLSNLRSGSTTVFSTDFE
jgi:hypothetical protein